ncbi:MFS transporter, partial [Butyricicoccus sp. 1XD8-22]
SEESAASRGVLNADIYGANVAFIVVAVLSLIGLIISCFIKDQKRVKEVQINKIEVS